MSAARVTVHQSIIPDRCTVRYGTPSTPNYLGTIDHIGKRWEAVTPDGYQFPGCATRAEAVSLLMEEWLRDQRASIDRTLQAIIDEARP